MVATYETFVLTAKDFFGDAVFGTWLEVYREEDLIFKENFVDGRLIIRVPLQLKPGLYDFVGKRRTEKSGLEAEEEVNEYRIEDVFVPFSTHIFRHAALHRDLQLKDGNFADDTVIDLWKFNSELSSYLNSATPAQATSIIAAIEGIGNPNYVAGEARVELSKSTLRLGPGKAFVDGNMIHWTETVLPLPLDNSYLGILNGMIDFYIEEPDLTIARIFSDGGDYYRLYMVTPRHHMLQPGTETSIYVVAEERETNDVVVPLEDGEFVFGRTTGGKITGPAYSTSADESLSFRSDALGVLATAGRLQIEATEAHALLWDDQVLLVALPRWEMTYYNLEWGDDLSFTTGTGLVYTHYYTDRPYPAIAPTFMDGDPSTQSDTTLEAVGAGWYDTFGYGGISSENERLWEGTSDLLAGPQATADLSRLLVRFRYIRPDSAATLVGHRWRKELSLVGEHWIPKTGYLFSAHHRLGDTSTSPALILGADVSYTDPPATSDALPRYLETKPASSTDVTNVSAGGVSYDTHWLTFLESLNKAHGLYMLAPLPLADDTGPYNAAASGLGALAIVKAFRRIAILRDGGDLTTVDRRLLNAGVTRLQDRGWGYVERANDVPMLWLVSGYPNPDVQANSWFDLYPGDAYVDWVGINIRHNAGLDALDALDRLNEFHGVWAVRHRKPLVVSYTVTGSTPNDATVLEAIWDWVRTQDEPKMLLIRGALTSGVSTIVGAFTTIAAESKFVKALRI